MIEIDALMEEKKRYFYLENFLDFFSKPFDG